MGARGNIVFIFPNGQRVYFYTHRRGHRLHEILREAMNWQERWTKESLTLPGKRGERCRWDDPAYFARVVFSRLVAGEEESVSCFGIDVERTPTNGDELHVDTSKQEIRQVRLDAKPGKSRSEGVVEHVIHSWTYAEFSRFPREAPTRPPNGPRSHAAHLARCLEEIMSVEGGEPSEDPLSEDAWREARQALDNYAESAPGSYGDVLLAWLAERINSAGPFDIDGSAQRLRTAAPTNGTLQVRLGDESFLLEIRRAPPGGERDG